MADVKPDWEACEDEDVTPGGAEAVAEIPPVQASVKPDVQADPAIPSLVLPKPQVKVEPLPPVKPAAEEKPEADNFPTGLKESFALLATFQGADHLGDRPTPAQVIRFKKYMRLRAHVSKLQQGMPLHPTTAHTKGAYVGIQTADNARLNLLVRTNPLVKRIVTERNALREKIEKLTAAVTGATNLDELKKLVADLTQP